jgi:hypothetical protein
MGRPITPIPRKATLVAVEDSYVFVLILAMMRKDSAGRGKTRTSMPSLPALAHPGIPRVRRKLAVF